MPNQQAGPRKIPSQARSRRMVDAILEAAAGVLAERGYAGTSTNLVAERAGVSVGSVYQYFPNKDSLVAALHERHAGQMYQVIEAVLGTGQRGNLRSQVEAMVRALMAAHMVEPRLHRVLEQELPFFEVPKANDSPSDRGIFSRVQQLLEQHRADIVPQDIQLAAWVIQRIIESMVHAAVIEPPLGFSMPEIERSIVDAVLGYLGVH
ncbi:TetR family transcriptional regulator [Mitsuaria sp. WAJ17]|nr:TetR family transcriptional regulator [Mitsuaria sp. WAJ17]